MFDEQILVMSDYYRSSILLIFIGNRLIFPDISVKQARTLNEKLFRASHAGIPYLSIYSLHARKIYTCKFHAAIVLFRYFKHTYVHM